MTKDLEQARCAPHPSPVSGTWSASFRTYDKHYFAHEVDSGATFAMLQDDKGRYVADVHALVEDGPSDAALRERAALIVKAVNSHQQLVDALKHYADELCEGWCMEAGGTFDDCGGCKARAALTATEA